MKHTAFIRYGLLIALVLISFISCKKSGSTTKSLLGDWYEQANPGGYSKVLSFGADGTFVAIFTTYPQPSPNGPVGLTVTNYKGTFKIKGDSLLTNLTTMSVTENNGTPVITPVNHVQKLYDYATFKLNNSKLTINYTTYPADL
jgi:hypothetical protein